MLKQGLALARRMGFDYACFRIYSIRLDDPTVAPARLPPGYRFAQVTAAEIEASPHAALRACRSYLGDDAFVFGIYRDDDGIVCAQCVWAGERYRRSAFWPLAADEAASMHLVTAVGERGHGLATCIKVESARVLRARGYTRLYSRIWWTNRPSLRVSEKSGWTWIGTTLDVKLPGLRRLRVTRARPGAR